MALWRRIIRFRLTLWYTGTLAVILVGFAIGVYFYAYSSLNAQIAMQLSRDLASIERLVQQDLHELEELEQHATVTTFHVDENRKLLFQTRSWERLGFNSVLGGMTEGKDHAHAVVGNRRYRIQTRTVQRAGKTYVIAAATEEEPVQHALSDLRRILLIASPLALLVACLGGYLLAARMLSPIARIAYKARQISAERLSERLPIENRRDEIGKLAHVFNHLLARLESSFGRLRRFTADASHELRTPLTAIRSVGEVALRERKDEVGYREVIGSMLEEVDRLTRLVDSLLFLTRADAGSLGLLAEPIDAVALARDVIEHLRVLAEEKSQTITFEAAERAQIAADRVTLRQALINLIHNAIRYSPPDSEIRLTVSREAGDEVVIAITDHGPGVLRDDHQKIFERFYRVDAARSREDGGVWLGLSIARWAVEANRGRIELESRLGQGSTFRIVLPAVSSQDD